MDMMLNGSPCLRRFWKEARKPLPASHHQAPGRQATSGEVCMLPYYRQASSTFSHCSLHHHLEHGCWWSRTALASPSSGSQTYFAHRCIVYRPKASICLLLCRQTSAGWNRSASQEPGAGGYDIRRDRRQWSRSRSGSPLAPPPRRGSSASRSFSRSRSRTFNSASRSRSRSYSR